MYAIEKGVPIPRVHKRSKFPFDEMEIGDSFVIPVHPRKRGIAQSSVHSAAKREGIKIATRYVEDDHGLRVWLTSREK